MLIFRPENVVQIGVPKVSTQIFRVVMMMLIESLLMTCRLGDKAMLKTFLVNNPEIDLDMMDPEGKLIYQED